MSEAYQDDPETRRTIEDFKRMLRQKSRQERDALLRQARDEALAEELEEAREISERDAEALRETLTQTNPREQAMFARDQAKSAALLLIMLFLILWLIAAATGRNDILRFPGAPPQPTPLQPRLGSGEIRTSSVGATSVDMNAGAIGQTPPVGVAFQDFYAKYGGARVFGNPISVEYGPAGQRYQWFERALLKEFPQFAGSDWAVQGDRLGVTATKGITFPTQAPFIGSDGARYFQETSHGLKGRFLDFWNANNGLIVLGMPISEEILETLPDQRQYTVQYFERGRLELHPENAGTADEVQIGLLGLEINRNPNWSRIISMAVPTPMPSAVVPASAAR